MESGTFYLHRGFNISYGELREAQGALHEVFSGQESWEELRPNRGEVISTVLEVPPYVLVTNTSIEEGLAHLQLPTNPYVHRERYLMRITAINADHTLAMAGHPWDTSRFAVGPDDPSEIAIGLFPQIYAEHLMHKIPYNTPVAVTAYGFCADANLNNR